MLLDIWLVYKRARRSCTREYVEIKLRCALVKSILKFWTRGLWGQTVHNVCVLLLSDPSNLLLFLLLLLLLSLLLLLRFCHLWSITMHVYQQCASCYCCLLLLLLCVPYDVWIKSYHTIKLFTHSDPSIQFDSSIQTCCCCCCCCCYYCCCCPLLLLLLLFLMLLLFIAM